MSGQTGQNELFDEAKQNFLQGNYVKARELLTIFLKDNPGNPQALKNLTSIKMKEHPPLSAADNERVRRIYKNYDNGYKHFNNEDFEYCLESFHQVAGEAENFELVDHFAETVGDLIAEIELEREVLENNREIQTLFDEGKKYFDEQMYDECIEKMMSILSIDPGHEDAVAYINEAAKLKES